MRPSTSLPAHGTKVTHVQRLVGRAFNVLDVRWDGVKLIFFVQLIPDNVEEAFERVRRELRALSLIPMLRTQGGPAMLVVTPKPVMNFRPPQVNLAMLMLTLFTTIWAGALFWSSYDNVQLGDYGMLEVLIHPRLLGMGALTFALPLMTILGVHELGHYFMARRHGLEASLPFFIPLPPITLLGTMGAFISIREPIPNRKALLDIGVAGPIAGFLMAIPITLVGLLLTELYGAPVPEDTGTLVYLGTPAIFAALERVSQALVSPTGDYLIHPVAFAGWAGFLVTALNLLPAGQLDGGHIARALLGEKAHYASLGAMGFMLVLGLFGLPFLGIPAYQGWLIFALIIMFLGLQHPPPLEDVTMLDTKRLAVGGFALFMLVSSFVAAPLVPGESPFDFSLEVDQAHQELNGTANSTEFKDANYTFTYTLWVNNTGSVWDNFTFNLTTSTTNWTVQFIANGSGLNQTQVEELEVQLEPGANYTFQVGLTRDPFTAPENEATAVLKAASVKTGITKSLKLTGKVTGDEAAGGGG